MIRIVIASLLVGGIIVAPSLRTSAQESSGVPSSTSAATSVPERFVQGDIWLATRDHRSYGLSEFGFTNGETDIGGPSGEGLGAAEIPIGKLAIGAGLGYRIFDFSPISNDHELLANLGVRIARPRIYLSAAYLDTSDIRSNKLESGVGFQIRKLPDLDRRVAPYGSFTYIPALSFSEDGSIAVFPQYIACSIALPSNRCPYPIPTRIPDTGTSSALSFSFGATLTSPTSPVFSTSGIVAARRRMPDRRTAHTARSPSA